MRDVRARHGDWMHLVFLSTNYIPSVLFLTFWQSVCFLTFLKMSPIKKRMTLAHACAVSFSLRFFVAWLTTFFFLISKPQILSQRSFSSDFIFQILPFLKYHVGWFPVPCEFECFPLLFSTGSRGKTQAYCFSCKYVYAYHQMMLYQKKNKTK